MHFIIVESSASDINHAKNPSCPGCATQNLPPNWRKRKGPIVTFTLPCPMVANFGLHNRDIKDFSACVMSDADELYLKILPYFKVICTFFL